MTRTTLISLIAATALLGACGDDDSGPTTAKPAEDAAQSARDWPGVADAALSAGKSYRSVRFTPALTITIPEGSTMKTFAEENERHAAVSVLPPDGVDQATLAFHRFDRVIDPRKGAKTAEDAVPAPGEFLAWLGEHPHLKVSAAEPLEIGGVSGEHVDVTVESAPKRMPDECIDLSRDCVPLFVDADEVVVFPVGSRIRFVRLDVGDEPVYAELFADPADQFDRVDALLDPVLRSVRFGDAR